MTPGFKLLLFGLVLFATFWVYQIRESDVMSLVDRIQDPELHRPPTDTAESRRSAGVHPVREIVVARFLPKDATRPPGPPDAAAHADEPIGDDDVNTKTSADSDIDIEERLPDTALADGPDPGTPAADPERVVDEPPRETKDEPTHRPVPPKTVDFVEIEHIVKTDDSLWAIAERYFDRGTEHKKIARWNGLREKNPVIVPGMRLKIRVPRQDLRKQEEVRKKKKTRPVVHRVRRGDNLAALARRYYRAEANSESWRKIYNSNRKVLKDPNRLVIGMRLTIPDVAVSTREGR